LLIATTLLLVVSRKPQFYPGVDRLALAIGLYTGGADGSAQDSI